MTMRVTGPYLRDGSSKSSRSTKMQWVANVRRGALLDTVVLTPLVDPDTGVEVTACEAAELMEAVVATIERTGAIPGNEPFSPTPGDATALLMAAIDAAEAGAR